MRILVCVKQVPEMDGTLEVAPETGLPESLSGETRMDRTSAQAVEEALCLKEAVADTVVEAACVGPEAYEPAVRRALAMGADEGTLLRTEAPWTDGYAVAHALAVLCRERRPDLVVCGVMSEDLMAGQVGPMLASLLDLPLAAGVVAMSLAVGVLTVEREAEGGARDRIGLDLPAVVTVQTHTRPPRYPALSHVLRANRQQIADVPAALPEQGAASETRGFAPPRAGRDGVMLAGGAEDKARELVRVLRSKGLL